MKKIKGFTLIEMLIVVVIIGILSAIIIPRMSNQSAQARFTACQSQISSINNVIELLMFDQNKRPWQMNGIMPRLPNEWPAAATTKLFNCRTVVVTNGEGVTTNFVIPYYPERIVLCPVDKGNNKGYVVVQGRVSNNYTAVPAFTNGTLVAQINLAPNGTHRHMVVFTTSNVSLHINR